MMLWELPAGLLDVEGEDPLDAAPARARRGGRTCAAERWHVLVDLFNSPGRLHRGASALPGPRPRHPSPRPTPRARGRGDGDDRCAGCPWTRPREAVLAGAAAQPARAVVGILAACEGRAQAWRTLRPADAPLAGAPAPTGPTLSRRRAGTGSLSTPFRPPRGLCGAPPSARTARRRPPGGRTRRACRSRRRPRRRRPAGTAPATPSATSSRMLECADGVSSLSRQARTGSGATRRQLVERPVGEGAQGEQFLAGDGAAASSAAAPARRAKRQRRGQPDARTTGSDRWRPASPPAWRGSSGCRRTAAGAGEAPICPAGVRSGRLS